MLISDKFPAVTDNINLVAGEKDASFSSYNKEAFESIYVAMDESAKISTFDKKKVCGYDAILVTVDLSISGVNTSITQVLIDADKSYSITYTDISGELSSIIKTAVDDIIVYK